MILFILINPSCPRVLVSQHKQQSTIIWLGITRLGSARLSSVERYSSKRATSSAFLLCAPSPSLLSSSVAIFFLNAQTHEKRTTKTSRVGTKMSCDGLTLGKIIFRYTPRVVLPPPQPVSNTMMEQVERWGEDVSNDGLDAISAH